MVNCLKSLFLEGISPQCGTLLIAALANALSEGLIVEQIDALGSFLTALGETLDYIASQIELNEKISSLKQM